MDDSDELADRVYQQMLVVRSQLGDRAAFAELIARCQPKLRGFVHRMVGADSNTAEDLLQEIWMDVFQDVQRLVNPSAFVPWLYRIARNRVFRAMRRAWPQSIEDVDAGELVDDASDPSEPDFGAEDALAVHAAMARLSPQHREVLLLRFTEQMNYEQIALVVGCEVGTVKSRIHNAKRQIGRILNERRGREAT